MIASNDRRADGKQVHHGQQLLRAGLRREKRPGRSEMRVCVDDERFRHGCPLSMSLRRFPPAISILSAAEISASITMPIGTKGSFTG